MQLDRRLTYMVIFRSTTHFHADTVQHLGIRREPDRSGPLSEVPARFRVNGRQTGDYRETGFEETSAGSAFDRTTLPPSRLLDSGGEATLFYRP